MRRSLPVLLSVCLVATLAATSGGAAVSQTPSFTARVLRSGGGEPNIAISPSGRTILVSGLGRTNPANLYRSTDSGKTFSTIRPAFSRTGGGDWDMRWLDDRTVVAADLSFLDDGIFIHRSENAGLTWTTTNIAEDVYDRPWIDHFGRDRVYVVAKGFDMIPYLYVSTDGGRSFGAPPIPVVVYGTGAVPAEAGGTSPTAVEAVTGGLNAYVDHITVDPRTGDVYVLYGVGGADTFGPSQPLGVSNRIYVAHLENGAMVSRPVYLGGAGESFISGFNWMTVDDRGTLYVLANGARAGHHSAWLSFSKDRGVTWSPLVDVGGRGAANVYGSIAAGGHGTLSLVSLRGSNENPATAQNWYVEMARVVSADTSRPVVYRTRPVRAPVHTADICFDGILCGLPGFGENRNLLDYIWNAVAPDGTAYAVVSSDAAATGDDGENVSVLLLRQTGGARHGRGAPS